MYVLLWETSFSRGSAFSAPAECVRGALSGLPQKPQITAPTARIPPHIIKRSRFIASSPDSMPVRCTNKAKFLRLDHSSRRSRRFDEPIELPDGRKLKTLAEAMAWLAKEIPKSEHKMEKVQTAAHCVTRAAEHGGPMIFAQMGMLQAIHGIKSGSSIPIAKTHIGGNAS